MKHCGFCDRDVRALNRARRCNDCASVHNKSEAQRGALVSHYLRYEDDVAAQLVVAAWPDGATLEVIADAMGVTRERVRQIEERALRRLYLRMRVAGVELEDLQQLLRRCA